MSQASSNPDPAKSPFHHIDADVILRSSDGIDYRVFKAILSLTSPVFRDMFALPQPRNESHTLNTLPVVDVSENAATLEALLLLIYPVAPPNFATPDAACAVIDAAVKYDIAIVVERVSELIALHFLEKSPLSVYAISCRLGWKDLAKRAAFETLKIRGLGRPSQHFEELESITGGAYHRLLSYHFKCGTAARGVAWNSTPWIPASLKGTCSSCSYGICQHAWFTAYLTESGEELLARPHPSTLDVESSSFRNAIHEGTKRWACNPFPTLLTLHRTYAERVQKAIADVPLEFKS